MPSLDVPAPGAKTQMGVVERWPPTRVGDDRGGTPPLAGGGPSSSCGQRLPSAERMKASVRLPPAVSYRVGGAAAGRQSPIATSVPLVEFGVASAISIPPPPTPVA